MNCVIINFDSFSYFNAFSCSLLISYFSEKFNYEFNEALHRSIRRNVALGCWRHDFSLVSISMFLKHLIVKNDIISGSTHSGSERPSLRCIRESDSEETVHKTNDSKGWWKRERTHSTFFFKSEPLVSEQWNDTNKESKLKNLLASKLVNAMHTN